LLTESLLFAVSVVRVVDGRGRSVSAERRKQSYDSQYGHG
jgi:hypothetical protein